jgi:hypothetical protein
MITSNMLDRLSVFTSIAAGPAIDVPLDRPVEVIELGRGGRIRRSP